MTSSQQRRMRTANPQGSPKKPERVRFLAFTFDQTPAGRVTCTVTLQCGSSQTIGTAIGQASPAGDTRLGAEAAMRALETILAGAIAFELVGVKVVRAFDASVVITSLIARSENEAEKVLGCVLTERDLVRASALSVLNATNRIVGAYIQDN